MHRVFSPSDLAFYVGLLTILSAGFLFPDFGVSVLRPIERAGSHFATRKGMAILALMVAVPIVRVALLPVMPVPVPAIHDEFSFLLAADTFAHGRLTNPPHPLWKFLETIHINQLPTYMSKYPPAQGAILAVGQLLGHPWIGVVLSVSLMCGAVLWMLQGWLPARWALLGAVLVFLRLAIFSYWMNSYWGGAVAAAAGALVVGALPRILRWQRPQDALLLGLGAAVLANSRPLEGFLFCLPVAVYLVVWLFRRQSPGWRVTLPRVCVPILLILLPTGIFMGYYNWRLTGNPLLLPYVVNDRTYLSTPHFFWQGLEPPIRQSNPQLDDFYNRWARTYWLQYRFAVHLRAAKFVYFFLWPELCVALIALPWLWRDRRIRFLLIQFVFCFAGLSAVVWFEPHYAAPLLATVVAIVVQAIRHIRYWQTGDRAYGVAIARAILIFSVAMNLTYVVRAYRNPRAGSFVAPAGVWGIPGNWSRARIEAELESHPDGQLAIVRYLPGGGGEWVYNKADIDHAKVVWAREIPGMDIRPLLSYFRGREVWLVEPTGDGARVIRYPGMSGQR
jgi:hypothetical protein